MELQEQDIALLEAYLAGKLAGEDLQACKARLQAEPALAEMLSMMLHIEAATQQTASASMKKEMAVAKAAAVAAGMATYTPAINAPATGGSFLGRLLRFLIKMALIGGAAWLIWKYVLHERLPEQALGFGTPHSTTKTTTTTTTTTKTTIKRDTFQYEGPAAP